MNFFRGVRHAKQLIKEGKIGNVLYAHSARNGWEEPQPTISWKRSAPSLVNICTITFNYLDVTMTEVEIDGHLYIGYLSVPVLELELPVMSGWDYPSLQIAPCRYSGTVRGEDLVLMAHNYVKHFGNIDQLEPGDAVLFTDMDGVTTGYEIVAVDILAPSAVE